MNIRETRMVLSLGLRPRSSLSNILENSLYMRILFDEMLRDLHRVQRGTFTQVV